MTSGPNLAGKKILIVDDEPDTLEVECFVLERYGAEVLCVRDAREALEVVPRFHPDLVISDIAMPGMDGIEFIRELRALPAESGGAVPALAVSAHVSGGSATEARGAGYDRFMRKPIMPAELVAVVADLTASPA
jgi:CheY-like chemotaxis protein